MEWTVTDAEVRRIVRETVMETLLSLGVDHENPLEMQQDFQHLRDWRVATQSVKRKGVGVMVTVLVTGMIGALIVGLHEEWVKLTH